VLLATVGKCNRWHRHHHPRGPASLEKGMVRASGIEPLTPTMSKLARKWHKGADSIGIQEIC
jgi:hypothetical protein